MYGDKEGEALEQFFANYVRKQDEERLMDYRMRLCDLLQGRIIRARGYKQLAVALELEVLGAPVTSVREALDIAVHWEWMATIAESGQVLWGGRNNRLGRPEDA